jgi:hypothetical protein
MGYSQHNKKKSKEIKPDYAKFIDLLIYHNQDTPSGADVFVVQSDIDVICNEAKLKIYLDYLQRRKIIESFENGKPYKKGTEDNIKGIYIRCLMDSKDMKLWRKGLHIPGESGLEISDDFRIIKRSEYPDKIFPLEERDAYVLKCLYKNKNEPILIREIINNSNGIISNTRQVAVSVDNLRRRLKNPLGFEDIEIKRILPRANKGTYKIML